MTNTTIIPAAPKTNPRVEYIRLGVKVGTCRATKKLVEERVVQEVNRAINAWFYSQ